MSSHELIGIVAGLIDFISFAPYIRSIVKGQTKPERASFAIWTTSSLLLLASYFASGARDTIWFLLSYSVMQVVVLFLSYKYGMGGFNKLDIVCIVGALLGLTLWIVTDNPLTAVLLNLVVDVIGFIPTIKKIYFLPETENKLSWSMAAIASLLNLLAINKWTFGIAVYPVVILWPYWLVVVLLLFPRRKLKQSKAELYKKF